MRKGPAELHLRPMLMDLLVLLAENAGHVVSKDQILNQLWQSEFVAESALTHNVAELRGLLGDSAPLSLVGQAWPAVLAVKGSLCRARPAKGAGTPARP